MGRRLSLPALALAYRQQLTYSGPTFNTMTIKDGKAELTFRNTDKGLVIKGDKLTGFAICGADKQFVIAQAKIDGQKVIVWSDQVKQPLAVRYAWANNPECDLYNTANLPAVSFRTDRD